MVEDGSLEFWLEELPKKDEQEIEQLKVRLLNMNGKRRSNLEQALSIYEEKQASSLSNRQELRDIEANEIAQSAKNWAILATVISAVAAFVSGIALFMKIG